MIKFNTYIIWDFFFFIAKNIIFNVKVYSRSDGYGVDYQASYENDECKRIYFNKHIFCFSLVK